MPRFEKVDRPFLPPACCFFNRTDNDEWFLDPQYSVDEGAIYIGKAAFEDMATTVGYVSPEKYKKLLDAYKGVVDELNALTSIISGSGDAINQLLSNLTELQSAHSAITGREEGSSKPRTKS